MAAKSNLKRVTLELGGKSPAVVFDDCNLDNAVNWTVNAITGHSGQVCFAASRVYVQEGIYDKFIEKYKEMFAQRTKVMGDPDAEETVLGPLVDEAQFERVTGFIERAKGQKSGTLLTGGARIGDKGYFVEPTVFTDVKSDSEIHTDEIFGPVSVVRTFKTEEEVLEISNNTEYGLMAGVCTYSIGHRILPRHLLIYPTISVTQDINKAMRIASAFDSGMVGINCISLMMMQAPFGGSKQSGVGRESGMLIFQIRTSPE